MNNGVTTNNTTSTDTQNTLAPMAGVKIAPVAEGPVDASKNASSTSVVNAKPAVETPAVAPQPAPAVPQTPTAPPAPATPVITQSKPELSNVQSNIAVPVGGSPVPPTTEAPALELSGPPKKKKSAVPLLLIIILGLIVYAAYSTKTFTTRIENLSYNCTPITSSKEDMELDLNSTIVQDLYSKVATNIREDLAQPDFNDNMKLYLAYRQISDEDKYDSNCNLFDKISMEPYTCEESTRFKPRAFKQEKLVLELKKLFGEKNNIQLTNVRLGTNSCIGGYQYIPQRGEFVEGLCESKNATSYKATKKLIKATSNRNTIILTEEVYYTVDDSGELPPKLKNGYYYYTFRLDMNYNYIFISKTYQSKS